MTTSPGRRISTLGTHEPAPTQLPDIIESMFDQCTVELESQDASRGMPRSSTVGISATRALG
ncbi:hypothetical protein NSERUTF1_1161 [Nocardia seriolae]|nr:hypothetical protein NSERUTF1_1161 [Nocardia seriolae]